MEEAGGEFLQEIVCVCFFWSEDYTLENERMSPSKGTISKGKDGLPNDIVQGRTVTFRSFRWSTLGVVKTLVHSGQRFYSFCMKGARV